MTFSSKGKTMFDTNPCRDIEINLFKPTLYSNHHPDFIKYHELYRGIGKTAFLCRLMLDYITRDWTNIIMYFRNQLCIEQFINKNLIPEIIKNKRFIYVKKNRNEIIIGEPYDIDTSVRKNNIIISLCVRGDQRTNAIEKKLRERFDYKTKIMEHDSISIDPVMAKELQIVREPDEKLPLYINHKWEFELLHQDFIKRLKMTTNKQK